MKRVHSFHLTLVGTPSSLIFFVYNKGECVCVFMRVCGCVFLHELIFGDWCEFFFNLGGTLQFVKHCFRIPPGKFIQLIGRRLHYSINLV